MRILMLFLFLTFCLMATAGHSQTNPEITCASVGVASCMTSEGMCLEFFAIEGADPEMWENMCMSFGGEFQETPCGQANIALSCLSQMNPMMPMTRYTTDFDLEAAKMACTGMGGTICPQ